jgi:hypothetical protein
MRWEMWSEIFIVAYETIKIVWFYLPVGMLATVFECSEAYNTWLEY